MKTKKQKKLYIVIIMIGRKKRNGKKKLRKLIKLRGKNKNVGRNRH
jgi:hypothetical protein